MVELELSLMNHNAQVEPLLRQILDDFQAKTGIRVHIQLLEWETGRAELTRSALYHHGSDVSEIGSTWVSDLVAMNALRPFSPPEVAAIGQPDEFAPAAWETCSLYGDKTIWAVPMVVESFMLHYRKDLFAQAGLDPQAAFASHAAMEQAALALRQCGVDVPVLPPMTHDRYGALHSLASWVWAAGGDFCSPDGRHLLLDEPEAMQGIQSYFRFMSQMTPAGAQMLAGNRGLDLFHQGKAAVAFGTRTFFVESLG